MMTADEFYAQIYTGDKFSTDAGVISTLALNPPADDDGEPSDEALVPVTCACPKCGEMRMDCLSLDEDIVTCVTCGEVYDISPAARMDRVMLDDPDDVENWSDRYALAHPGALM